MSQMKSYLVLIIASGNDLLVLYPSFTNFFTVDKVLFIEENYKKSVQENKMA